VLEQASELDVHALVELLLRESNQLGGAIVTREINTVLASESRDVSDDAEIDSEELSNLEEIVDWLATQRCLEQGAEPLLGSWDIV